MDLTQWLLAEHDDTAARLRGQVLDLVPAGRRTERPGGGSPILWNAFHLVRHAALALDVLEPGAVPRAPDWLPRLAGPAAGPSLPPALRRRRRHGPTTCLP